MMTFDWLFLEKPFSASINNQKNVCIRNSKSFILLRQWNHFELHSLPKNISTLKNPVYKTVTTTPTVD